VLVYVFSLRVFGHGVAALAAALFCFYPSLLFAETLLLTETVFTLLLILVVTSYVALLDTSRVWLAGVTGVAVGLAALTRSVLWPFPLVLAPLVFACVLGSVRRRMAIVAALLVGYSAIVVPWAVRNTLLQGVPTVVDTMGAINLRMGNYEHTPHERMWDAVSLTGDRSWSHDLQRERPDLRLTEGEKARWAQEKAVAFMLAHPLLTLRRSAIRLADFWGLEREFVAGIQRGLYAPPRWFTVLTATAIAGSYAAVALLASLGLFLAPPADRRVHVLLVLLVGWISGVHTLVYGHSRYHLPLVPILALYAAAALQAQSWSRLRLASTQTIVAVGTAALLLFVWGRELLVVDLPRIQAFLESLL
jgi:hypothetical protein